MGERVIDHEKLHVYSLELDFVTWTSAVIAEVRAADSVASRHVCDHLDRAALSALLNTAEGNGKRQRATRAKFFDDARGSAAECAACLDVLVAKKLCNTERVAPGKEMLSRIIAMLTKLVSMFSDEDRISEPGAEYNTATAEDEDDDEEEDEDEGEIDAR